MESKNQVYKVYSWTVPLSELEVLFEMLELGPKRVRPQGYPKDAEYIEVDLFSEQIIALGLRYDVLLTDGDVWVDSKRKRFKQR